MVTSNNFNQNTNNFIFEQNPQNLLVPNRASSVHHNRCGCSILLPTPSIHRHSPRSVQDLVWTRSPHRHFTA
jgi:hypothetical protein